MTDDMMDRRFEVKSRLSPEEFVAFAALAEMKGLSQSSLLRMWIKEHCAAQASVLAARDGPVMGLGNVEPLHMKFAER